MIHQKISWKTVIRLLLQYLIEHHVQELSLIHIVEKLKERYDYIILDTAPIAIVTDTAIASRVADMCVYCLLYTSYPGS